MGRAIYIEKILENQNIHYYAVSSNSIEKPEFYMGLDPINNQLFLFVEKEFTIPLHIINFNKNIPIDSIKEIKSYAFKIAIARAYRAIRDKNFPQNMNSYS